MIEKKIENLVGESKPCSLIFPKNVSVIHVTCKGINGTCYCYHSDDKFKDCENISNVPENT